MRQDLKTIPYGKHSVDADDIDAVVDVLSNHFLTQGKLVPAFENAVANYTGSAFCTAVNSGTSGLHVACLAAGVTKGDWVWTVPNSFVASANCALYCGAKVDFVDIDKGSRNISLSSLQEKLAKAKGINQLPKVLIVVHFAGFSCEMAQISELCKQHNIVLIEDAAHGLGGTYKQVKIGSCKYSDMTVLSFHPVKSITTAEGGAITTNSDVLHTRLQLFAKHGVTRDPKLMEGDSQGPWYYQQVELGYNYRMSDIHAALGISQLSKLDEFIQLRNEKASRYQKELSDLPLKLPKVVEHSLSAWHVYVIELTRHDRGTVFEQLRERGVGVNVHYIPIHTQPYFKALGFQDGDFPNAEEYYRNAITIPLFPAMSADEQTRVVKALHEVLG